MTLLQYNLLRQVADAVLAAVAAAGSMGAPAGVLYAGMMAQGCTIQQFDGIMAGLVGAGMLTKGGDCYHLTAKGAAWGKVESAVVA